MLGMNILQTPFNRFTDPLQAHSYIFRNFRFKVITERKRIAEQVTIFSFYVNYGRIV